MSSTPCQTLSSSPPPEHRLDGLAGLAPAMGEDKFITAGNASQLSDAASACVVMDGTLTSRRGLEPLSIYRGLVVTGCEPDEMCIGGGMGAAGLFEIA